MKDKTKKILLGTANIALSFVDMILLNKLLSDYGRRIDRLEKRMDAGKAETAKKPEEKDQPCTPDDDTDYVILNVENALQTNIHIVTDVLTRILKAAQEKSREACTPKGIRFKDITESSRAIMTCSARADDPYSLHIDVRIEAGPAENWSSPDMFTPSTQKEVEETAQKLCSIAHETAMKARVAFHEALWLDTTDIEQLKRIMDIALYTDGKNLSTCFMVTNDGLTPVRFTIERVSDSAGRHLNVNVHNDKAAPGEKPLYPTVIYDWSHRQEAAAKIMEYLSKEAKEYLLKKTEACKADGQ